MDKLLIYGTGSVANVLVDQLNSRAEVLAFVNTNSEVQTFRRYSVITLNQIHQYSFDYIIIASGYYLKMEKQLLDMGVPNSKIVGYIYDEMEFYSNVNENIDDYLNKRTNRNLMKRWTDGEVLLPALCGITLWKNNGFKTIRKDFVREQILSLLATEIKQKKVKGLVAELGVFQGDFTVCLDEAFDDRTLILFDTFEGFVETDVNQDQTIDNKANELLKFKNTSVDLVLSRLHRDSTSVIVKKGLFPDTFDMWEDKFSFVSIDLNLKEPVLQALQLFYPRMVDNGYILVSDYNAPFYEGTREAVSQFCRENGVKYIPLPDLYGSVVIIK